MTDDRPAILGGPHVRPSGPPGWPPADPAVQHILRHAAEEGWWGRYHGPHAGRLAERIAERMGGGETLLCCSGTAAVELALRGMKVGPGDEVILAAYEFKGNFQDIVALGAQPVLVDVDPCHWNLDPAHLTAALSERTKAILVSHLHGGVVEMPAVREFADRHGLQVLEDVCQCPGARIYGRTAGAWGDAAVFSFGGSKLLTAGRGGAVWTRDAGIAQRIRLSTQRGNDAYPLSELQAAILGPQWERLEERNAARARFAERLMSRMASDGRGLTPFRNPASDSSPGYYKLGIQYDPAEFAGLTRDQFAQAIRAEGVALDPGFRALHLIHSRRRFRSVGELPEATRADRHVLTLHHPVLLEPWEAVDEIVAAVRKIRRWAPEIVAAGFNGFPEEATASEWS